MCSFGTFGTRAIFQILQEWIEIEIEMFGDNGHVQSVGLFKHLDIATALQC